MIISAKGCWSRAEKKHAAYFDSIVRPGLLAQKKALTARIFDFLSKRHDQIRDGDERILRGVQADFEKILDRLTVKSQAKVLEALKRVYAYDAFARKHPTKWCAYRLCEDLEVLTCPYCNLAYGHTLTVSSDGVVRPTLDHYFDKATYPIFAISLGNLIASCYQCNSSLKGSKDFYKTVHLNPLISTENVTVSLDVDRLKARFDLKEFDKANIRLKYDQYDSPTSNSVRTFFLEERYQFLVDEARFIAKNMQTYKTAPHVNSGRLEWITRGVNAANYKNMVLGKLIKDFSAEFL